MLVLLVIITISLAGMFGSDIANYYLIWEETITVDAVSSFYSGEYFFSLLNYFSHILSFEFEGFSFIVFVCCTISSLLWLP